MLCRVTKKGMQAGCNDGFQFVGNSSPGTDQNEPMEKCSKVKTHPLIWTTEMKLIFENTLRDHCNSAEHVVKPNHVQI